LIKLFSKKFIMTNLIEGFENVITHIKNQETRIEKQQNIINYLKEDLNVALLERDQADEFNNELLNSNIFYSIFYIVKYKWQGFTQKHLKKMMII